MAEGKMLNLLIWEMIYSGIKYEKYKDNCSQAFYNHFHNILKLFDVLQNFPFTTRETIGNYYL